MRQVFRWRPLLAKVSDVPQIGLHLRRECTDAHFARRLKFKIPPQITALTREEATADRCFHEPSLGGECIGRCLESRSSDQTGRVDIVGAADFDLKFSVEPPFPET